MMGVACVGGYAQLSQHIAHDLSPFPEILNPFCLSKLTTLLFDAMLMIAEQQNGS